MSWLLNFKSPSRVFQACPGLLGLAFLHSSIFPNSKDTHQGAGTNDGFVPITSQLRGMNKKTRSNGSFFAGLACLGGTAQWSQDCKNLWLIEKFPKQKRAIWAPNSNNLLNFNRVFFILSPLIMHNDHCAHTGLHGFFFNCVITHHCKRFCKIVTVNSNLASYFY